MAVLANRIKRVVRQYVHEDQTGLIPGRDIEANIQRTLNAIVWGRKAEIPSVLVAVDIEKAFDTVEVPYMTALLENMALGKNSSGSFDRSTHPRLQIC